MIEIGMDYMSKAMAKTRTKMKPSSNEKSLKESEAALLAEIMADLRNKKNEKSAFVDVKVKVECCDDEDVKENTTEGRAKRKIIPNKKYEDADHDSTVLKISPKKIKLELETSPADPATSKVSTKEILNQFHTKVNEPEECRTPATKMETADNSGELELIADAIRTTSTETTECTLDFLSATNLARRQRRAERRRALKLQKRLENEQRIIRVGQWNLKWAPYAETDYCGPPTTQLTPTGVAEQSPKPDYNEFQEKTIVTPAITPIPAPVNVKRNNSIRTSKSKKQNHPYRPFKSYAEAEHEYYVSLCEPLLIRQDEARMSRYSPKFLARVAFGVCEKEYKGRL